ncbi:uncharacterized protein LOC114525465 [Dendronephthya gigantea]|uniref:uncharacterized protein LOC114525465 n=1 Tax=Dendronephthya gigantea TaxID=151771 RepID=UPI00106CD7AC|nr:uncharacterized protein LOC114525465 [Dendronephthya gigantea]
MGYKRAESVVNTSVLPDSKVEIFSGTINCNHDDNDLSFCSFSNSTSSCSQLSYIKCHICDSPLLEDKERIPDSSFTASSEGHRASDARISSGSSWCAPVSDGKHYLQVDFKTLYSINYIATFGDGTSAKWVKTYILNYTTDLINWKQSHAVFQKIFRGNQNAFNGAAIRNLNGLTTRALRFIPLSYEVQPCMRIEICGQRAAGFFVKHVKTGMCVIDTEVVKHSGPFWGSLSFLELSNNSCFDEAAQFRFRDNGALFNIKRKGCLAAYFKHNFGSQFDVFYLYVPATSLALDYSACAQDPGKKIYRRITQTFWGGLSVYYKGYTKTTFQNWCTVPKTHAPLAQNYGIDPYIGLTTDCNDAEDKRFIFGSVTCYGRMVGNINCPKDQFMVVKTASYRGLSDSKTCGLSDDYSCTVDVTCLVKKQCDGQHECKITVNETLFSDDFCHGFNKYLYFEYQCIDTVKSYSVVCGHICDNPLLEDKERFPDSSFTASVSSEGHRASDARIFSGSSWCASVSDGKHYLQVNLGRLYVLYNVTTFGDSTSAKWVKSYNINYTVDSTNWKQVQTGNHKIFQGNKNAFNDAAKRSLNDITTKALRFIPLSHEVQPCMRVEICGDTLYPDQPRNITVSNITTRSVEISWIDPENQGLTNVSRFRIKMKKDDSLILNITTGKIYEYKIDKLTTYTSYEISLAAGNKDGFSEENTIVFSTGEEAPEGPPLNVKVTAESSSSLSVTWDPPEEEKRNGDIVNYTVCISHEETKPCFKEHTTEKMMLVIDSLNASTKYFVRVLASTRVGRGNYSKSQGMFTNGEGTKVATKRTETTLTFSLQIPSENFTYFYVVALELRKSSDCLRPSSSYNDLVTYKEATTSAEPKPYIAAVITSRDKNMFILGDGGNTSFQTTRRRRSSTNVYYNGPLESGASYSIFQRIFLDDKGEFYSTDWSPASTTVTQAPRPSLTTNTGGAPGVLTNMSSGDVMAKEGDLVTLLCSAQGEPPITFSWEKDQTSLDGFIVKDMPHRSSLLVVTMKDETSFGKYICNIQDRFTKTAHNISVVKLTAQEECEGCGNHLVGIIVLIILLVILLIIIAYLLFHRVHRLKSSSTTGNLERKTKDSSKDIYENPNKDDVNNYEQVENEQSTYTALKRPGKDEDDHVYSHLNQRPQEYENQKETGL